VPVRRQKFNSEAGAFAKGIMKEQPIQPNSRVLPWDVSSWFDPVLLASGRLETALSVLDPFG
jgi:hypothetical protein